MLLCAEQETQDVDASQHDSGNQGQRSVADWTTLFQASDTDTAPTPTSSTVSGSYLRGNTTLKQKEEQLLDPADMCTTMLHFKQRTNQQVENVDTGETSGGAYSCKLGCALNRDLCIQWMHDVRVAACVGTCAQRRAHLLNLLRNGNTSADQLPIDTCPVQGVKLCHKCFRQVFNVRMYLCWNL